MGIYMKRHRSKTLKLSGRSHGKSHRIHNGGFINNMLQNVRNRIKNTTHKARLAVKAVGKVKDSATKHLGPFVEKTSEEKIKNIKKNITDLERKKQSIKGKKDKSNQKFDKEIMEVDNKIEALKEELVKLNKKLAPKTSETQKTEKAQT